MDRYRIKAGHDLDLSKWDADDQSEFKGGKKSAQAKATALVNNLSQLQELLYAELQTQDTDRPARNGYGRQGRSDSARV